MSPSSVTLRDSPLSSLPTLPDPTTTSPQDGPLGVAAPAPIAAPNLPPIAPSGSPVEVAPPPGFRLGNSGPQVTPQSWEDFDRWLQDRDKYAKSLEDELKNKTDEQLA